MKFITLISTSVLGASVCASPWQRGERKRKLVRRKLESDISSTIPPTTTDVFESVNKTFPESSDAPTNTPTNAPTDAPTDEGTELNSQEGTELLGKPPEDRGTSEGGGGRIIGLLQTNEQTNDRTKICVALSHTVTFGSLLVALIYDGM